MSLQIVQSLASRDDALLACDVESTQDLLLVFIIYYKDRKQLKKFPLILGPPYPSHRTHLSGPRETEEMETHKNHM